jgi:methylmalonyl-CoA mutase, N-terminal domain
VRPGNCGAWWQLPSVSSVASVGVEELGPKWVACQALLHCDCGRGGGGFSPLATSFGCGHGTDLLLALFQRSSNLLALFQRPSNIACVSNQDEWEADFDRARLRDVPFETMSGIPLRPVYGPEYVEFPGQWPYTRGPYASMYRSRLWTMRQFAGFGTAEDTNGRFKELLRSGGSGLSTAFDMPTLLGRDSDDPLAKGEVGRAGVAVDTQADMETLFSGIDLASVSTSMTINSAAPVIMAMYIGVADQTGVERRALSGTIQNDILKEYQAQKEYVFPPRPSVRLVTDLVRFATSELPRWHPVSISGYHIREAGSTAAQELAFTLANGFAYVEAALQAGLNVDEFGPRLSFFFNAHIDFFEEIAKYRAARRIWARWMRDRYGAADRRSLQLRFHTQTAGVSLTAQQPEVNIARVAIEALAGVLGGTQSLHTDSYDEALALPTEQAARLALRTQQVIAEESGVAHVADPLGGSWFVESLTDELERQAEEVFSYLLKQGSGSMLDGVVECIESGWFCSEIADAAYEFQSKIASKRWIQVGVNGYTDGDDHQPPTLYVDPSVEARQLADLAEIKQSRDDEAVVRSLERLRSEAADPTINLMPALIEAASRYVTVGECMGALESVFGIWYERSFV